MTLWPFQNVTCFSSPYRRSFVAPRLSSAYCLHWCGVAALISIPLLAAFASDNVWVKESSYREQPLVRFSHDAMLLLSGDSPEDAVGWGTRKDLYDLLPPEVRIPVVRSSAHDHNHDGIPDSLRLRFEMPAPAAYTEGGAGAVKRSKGFRHMLLLAVFSYELRGKVPALIGGLVAVDVSSPYSATGVWLQGQVRLRQRLPLRALPEVRSVYAQNPLYVDWRSNWAAAHYPITIQSLLERYTARNETIYLELTSPPVWDYSPRDSFIVQLAIDVHPQVVYYVPGAVEVLKWAWVQVASFLAPTWIFVHAVKVFAFEHQIIRTYVVPGLPSKDST